MKKLMILTTILMALGISTACADNDKPIAVTQLDGEWKEVECKYSTVPTAIIPVQIASYVSQNYPDTQIVQIDRDKRDYEVKLTNRLELTFDLNFNLIDIDD